MADTLDPYYSWLGIKPKDQPPHHYRLLALDIFEDDPTVIENAADQRMAHVRTFQTGRHSELSQKLLNEIAAAKVCLLSPKKKAAYDADLRAATDPAPAQAPYEDLLAEVAQEPEAANLGQPAAAFTPAFPQQRGLVRSTSWSSAARSRRKPQTWILMSGGAVLLLLLLLLIVSQLTGGPQPLEADGSAHADAADGDDGASDDGGAADGNLPPGVLPQTPPDISQPNFWANRARQHRAEISAAAHDGAAHYPYFQLASTLLMADDREGYRQLRSEMLDRYAATQQWFVADRIAKAALLLDEQGDHVERAAELSRRAWQLHEDPEHNYFLRYLKCFVAFRQGDYAAAAQDLTHPRNWQPHGYRLSGLMNAWSGDPDAARQYLLENLGILDAIGGREKLARYPDHRIAHLIARQAAGKIGLDADARLAWARDPQTWQTPDSVAWTSDNPNLEFQRQADGSYFLLGTPPDPDTEVCEAVFSPAKRQVTALRIELLTDERLVRNGPGRNPMHGKVLVTGLTLSARKADGTSRPAAFDQATGLDSFVHQAPRAAIDDDPETSWGVFHLHIGNAHTAAFTLAEPLQLAEDEQLVLEIRCQSEWVKHTLGRVRLSVTDRPAPEVP